MPTLDWMGKDKVITYHRQVPYRVLENVPEKGMLDSHGSDCGNMIIHGDNLEALKALLPEYEGKVDCIYIDPPYNTGNEGWVYNDNVNDPRIRRWLGEAVGKEGEDFSRHDKWLCMMYPRLMLLSRMLSPSGVIFISIDGNEHAALEMICDEIFGIRNRVATFIWRKVDSPNDNHVVIAPDHEYVLGYARNLSGTHLKAMPAESIVKAYGERDAEGRPCRDRLLRKNGRSSLREERPTMFYPLTAPDGTTVYPIRDDGRDGVWAMSLEGVEKKRERGLLIWKQRERNGETVWVPYAREYPADEPVRPYPTIWNDLWTMRQAKAKLKDIFKGETIFDTPKPPDLVERLIDLANVRPDGIVLDSFAGSGTTAEAVCAVNTGDDGHRRFILAEMGSYADSITATRVRRIISGYKTSRNVSETIYEKKLSATNLKDVESYYEEALQTRDDAGKRHRFDKLSGPKMDGSSIVVVGITAKSEKTPGLDIGFSYYELGQALFDADGSIDQDVPREEILKYVWYSETKAPYVDMTAKHPYLLGTIGGTVYYFAYEPDEETVLGPKLLSTLPERGSITVIYADRCVLDDAKLDELGIVFKQIPRQIARM